MANQVEPPMSNICPRARCCAPSGILPQIDRGYRPDALTDFLETVRQRCRFSAWYLGHYHREMALEQKYKYLSPRQVQDVGADFMYPPTMPFPLRVGIEQVKILMVSIHKQVQGRHGDRADSGTYGEEGHRMSVWITGDCHGDFHRFTLSSSSNPVFRVSPMASWSSSICLPWSALSWDSRLGRHHRI